MGERIEVHQFGLKFGGEGLASMDIRDLAPALLGLGDVFDGLHRSAGGSDRDRINLRVRAGFRQGSFEVWLEIVKTACEVVELLRQPDAASALSLLAILGVPGVAGAIKMGEAATSLAKTGLLQVFKVSKGKPIRKSVEIKHTKSVSVVFEGVEDEHIMDRVVARAYGSPGVRDGLAKLVSPLRSNGVERLEVIGFSAEPETILAPEAAYYQARSQMQELQSSETSIVFRIVAPTFDRGLKWRLNDGQSNHMVSIHDDAFLERVQAGAERFGAGDCIDTQTVFKQWLEDGVLRSSYEVIRVNKVIAEPRQIPLALDRHKDKE